jgi:hypothetical protein
MQLRSWLLAVFGAALLLTSLLAVTAEGSTSAVATFGTRGAAKLTSGGPDTVYVNLKNLPNGSWTEILYKGTCATLGDRIRTLSTLTVAGGVVRRTNAVTASQARAASKGVIRIAKGRTAYCAPFASAGVTPSPTSRRSAQPTARSSPSAGSCTFDGTYACFGDTLVVYFDDGSQGEFTVEAVTRSAADASGLTTLDVLVKVTGPANEDVAYNWQVGDIGGQPTMYDPQSGAPSPVYPTQTAANGVARGWLRFVIPAVYRPFLTNPGGPPIRLK